jgi:hypothetical protein
MPPEISLNALGYSFLPPAKGMAFESIVGEILFRTKKFEDLVGTELFVDVA